MADADRIQDWLNQSTFEELSGPVIGDPYGLYPEPRDESDILDDDDLDLVFRGDADDDSSEESEEDEVHHRPSRRKDASGETNDRGSFRNHDDWYLPQPFIYNGRILLVGLPGLLLTLSVGGDFLLTVITFGGIVTYLLHNAEEQRKSVISYVILFGCCQMTVLYSVFPLLWLSLYNFVLLSALNMFCVLTGGFGIIQFERFRKEEKDMTKLIEAMLFSLYPAVNVILITWLIASTASPTLGPYLLLILGFVVFQIFLTPTVSSFCRPDKKGNYKHYVMEPEMTGAVAIIYCLEPPMLFTVMSLFRYKWTSLGLNHAIECLFILMSSTFLSSLLNLRPFFNLTEIPYKNVLFGRWVSGTGALLLVSFVLQNYGFKLYLLPWLPMGIIIHAGYGFMISQKQTKLHGIAAAGILGILYGYMFYKLPWTLDHYLSNSLHINTVQLILLVNAALCIVCAYVSVYSSSEVLGMVLILQSLGYVLCEGTLLNELHFIPLVIISTGLAIYLFLKLHHVNKIPKQHSWISTSLHITKLLVTLNTYLSKTEETNLDYMYYLSTFILCLVISYIVLFENSTDITNEKFAVYGSAILFSSILGGHTCLGNLYQYLVGSAPSIVDHIGLGLLATGLCLLKLSTCHQCQFQWSRHISVVALVSGFTVIHLQPDFSFQGVDQTRWLFIFSLISVFVFIPLSTITKSRLLLIFGANCIGVPLGAAVALQLYLELVPASTVVLYGFVCGQLTSICFVAWKGKGSGISSVLNKLILVIISVCCILILDDIVAPIDDIHVLPGTLCALSATLTISLTLKLSPLHEKMEKADLTVSGNVSISYLAVVGNISSIVAFILTLHLCPTDNWEIWYIGSSVILILLQRDGFALDRISSDNYYIPLVLVTAVVLNVSTFQSSSYFHYIHTIHLLTGMVEIFLLFITLPNYLVLVAHIWFQRIILSERVVVFLTPLYVFLFVFGSTYVSWTMATYGLCLGTWLIKCKLAFD